MKSGVDLNGDRKVDRKDYEIFLANPQPASPQGPGGLIEGEFFAGNLDGIDLERKLLFIGGREFSPAEEFSLEDRDGRSLDPFQLLELVGSHPWVEAGLNEAKEIVLLTVLSRVEIKKGAQRPSEGEPGGAPAPQVGQEFFGAVAEVTAAKIVLSGPRFRVTRSTRAADQDNKPIELNSLAVGQLIAATPGPPDFASGSPDPTVVRIQLVDPRRPPPPRYDLISGNVTRFDGSTLELAGPISQYGPQTQFRRDDGQSIAAADIRQGAFVRIVTRQQNFGDAYPFATEVVLLPEGVGGQPPPLLAGGETGGTPAEEIRVEGFIASADEATRSLALEGEHLELDTRALVFGLDDERVELDYLVSGDLLEIDTRPGGRRGFLVTRIKVIDPATQTFNRPGVKVGSFESIEEGELVLTGPFFQVPEDAEINGQGGRSIPLGELEEGEYVRLAASPPRFDRGETLPVAFKIRVSQPPQGPPIGGQPGGQPAGPSQDEWLRSPEARDLDGNGRIDPADFEIFMRQLGGQGGPISGGQPGKVGPFLGGPSGRSVVSSFPEDGDVEIPTKTAVEATFNGQVHDLLFSPEFQFVVFPQPPGFGDLEISADGRTLSAEVELEKDRVYQLVVISRDTGLYSIQFSTGTEISTASVSGEIRLPPELPRQVNFIPGQSYAVLLDEPPADGLAPDSEDFERHIAAGTPLNGPRFRFENVNPGTYYLAAFLAIDLGRGEFFAVQALHPDPVVVERGAQVQVALEVQLPEPLSVVSLTPAPSSVNVELEAQVKVEFNKPAELSLEDLLIFPPPAEVGELEADESGKVYTLHLQLAEDTVYRVVVPRARDAAGGELAEAATTFFTTGEGFGGPRTLTGRLVLPDLPPNRRFSEPILVALVPYTAVDASRFGFESFEEEGILASTIAFTPEFAIENLSVVGSYAVVAFARVEVPKGFRPPSPRQRPLPAFDIRGGRFAGPGLEAFDTLELFGFAADAAGLPLRVRSGGQGVEIFLEGKAKTRDQLLIVNRAQGLAANSSGQFEPVVELLGSSGIVSWPAPTGSDLSQSGIRVEFNRALLADRRFVGIEAALNGQPLRRFNLEAEGRAVVFPVALQAGQFYRFSVFKAEGADGSRLEQPLEVSFSTGAASVALGSVAGHVSLQSLAEDGKELTGEEADQIDAATVFLFDQRGGEALSLVGAAEVDGEGDFLLSGILPGGYQVFAEINTASGQQLKDIYDTDGDGAADVIQVAGGSTLRGIDILASVVVATEEDTTSGVTVKTVPPGGNEGAGFSIDLDTSAGDQGQTSLSDVEAGQDIAVDVYVSQATDVSGFAAKVSYDPAVLEFTGAEEQVSGEANFLRQNNGTALFLSPLAGESTIEFGGAILGSTATTAVDGGGFLVRFNFHVLEGFAGTQISLESVDLRSLIGQDEVQPGLTAKLAPPVVLDQKKDVISLDFNTDPGDQEEFHKGFIAPGDLVEVDVYLNFDQIGGGDFKDLSNYSVTVEFNPDQLSFISYAPQTAQEENILIAGGGIVPQLPAIVRDNSATFGNAILGPTATAAPDNGGLIGRLTFATTDQFAQTDLLITAYSIKSVGGTQQNVSTLIFARLSTGEIELGGGVAGGGGTSAGPEAVLKKSDFDGDGAIGFGDLFLFSDVFGKSADTATAVFDLNGDGAIDFEDFFVFADLWGQSVGKQVVVHSLPLAAGGVQVAAHSTAEDLVVDLQSQGLALRGFGATVEYDPMAFQLLQVSDEGSALRQQGNTPLLLNQSQPGQVLVLGSRTQGAPAVEGVLARLHFRPLFPEARGMFRVREATVRDAQGRLAQAGQLGQVEAGWVPQVFALQANYPNPFNPSTTIRYQLPVDAPVRLEIYDVLGQKVRTLVAGVEAAGYHRVGWDGLDERRVPVAGGVYFYRLQAGNFTQVRKLLLLK